MHSFLCKGAQFFVQIFKIFREGIDSFIFFRYETVTKGPFSPQFLRP